MNGICCFGRGKLIRIWPPQSWRPGAARTVKGGGEDTLNGERTLKIALKLSFPAALPQIGSNWRALAFIFRPIPPILAHLRINTQPGADLIFWRTKWSVVITAALLHSMLL
jgi:hypothetical protein